MNEEKIYIGIFENYVQTLPLSECHDVLVDLKGDEQRRALIIALNETVGDHRDGWLELARFL